MKLNLFYKCYQISDEPVPQNSLMRDSENEEEENSSLLSTHPAPPSPSQVNSQASSLLTYPDLLVCIDL